MAVLAPVLALGLVAGACGSDRGGGSASPTTVAPGDRYGTAAMADRYDEVLEPLGWRVQRSALVERAVKGAPKGRHHVALYLRPVGEPTPAAYVDGLASVTKVFVPAVFDDGEVHSFDVCLEPTAAQDPSKEPRPLTQVLLSREQAASVDWVKADAAEVVAAGLLRHPNTLVLYVADSLKTTEEWKRVEAAAAARV